MAGFDICIFRLFHSFLCNVLMRNVTAAALQLTAVDGFTPGPQMKS